MLLLPLVVKDFICWHKFKSKVLATRNKDFISQTSVSFKNSVIQQTSSSSIKFNKMSITFSTTYFLYPRLPHSTTISGQDHILVLSSFHSTLDTLLTLPSLVEYCTKHLLTLSLNYTHIHRLKDKLIFYHFLTILCCSLLAFCQV